MRVYPHLGPVVEAGAAHRAGTHREAERLDKVQLGAHGGTGARDVAGVLRNLRLVQDDVQDGAVA